MKCDEGRPICINCSISVRQCYYSDQGDALLDSPPVQHLGADTGHAAKAALPLPKSFDPPVYPISAAHNFNQLFTFQHLFLLHHVERNMTNWLMVTEEMKPLAQAYIDSALNTPYLMDQLLAVSSLHLSTVHVDRSDLYHRMSAELQTRALTLFNRAKEDISDENIVSMFLFSSLLPINVLAEKLLSYRENFAIFLDGLVDYLHLHRGARVMGDKSWDVLRKSELEPWCTAIDESSKMDNAPSEWESLSRMLQLSDLNQKSTEACQTAKQALDFVCRRLKAPKSWGVHALMAWPSLISPAFIHLLAKRTPEALVILAHYAIFLHQFRDFWVFGNAGEYLIRNIIQVLGRHWTEWLETPRCSLGG